MTQDDKKFGYADGVSLREYVDMRFEENQRAIEKAENSMTARLEGMNEFREALRDQSSRFLNRTEVTLMIEPMVRVQEDHREKIDGLIESRAELRGKASQTSVFLAYAFSVIGIIMGLIGLLR